MSQGLGLYVYYSKERALRKPNLLVGDAFYVVEEGSFLIYSEAGSELARVSKGSCFGELALLRQVLPNPLPCSSPTEAGFAPL